MLALPLRESLVRIVEVQIVHLAIAAADDRIHGWFGKIGRGQRRGGA